MTTIPTTRRARFHAGRVVAALLALALGAAPASTQELGEVTPPQPTVPEYYTLEGEFVRIAYNNEGFASLGYRAAQQEAGNQWMLLQVGVTLRRPAPDYRLKREHLSIRTPDGKTIPLATQKEYGAANLMALNTRARAIHDSINYFPADATRGCPLQFFSDATTRGLAHDEVELSYRRACMGVAYFHVPGGIQTGQHWLDIQFASGPVQVPFHIFTKEQEKEFRQRWEDLKKQHEEAFGK